MWLMTTTGFFSVVKKPGDELLTVRARAREDLERLKARAPTLGDIVAGGGTDYPYRARITAADLAEVARQLVLDIDYGNFKNEVSARQGAARARAYGRVWGDLLDLEKRA